jgi:hypothetical protein
VTGNFYPKNIRSAWSKTMAQKIHKIKNGDCSTIAHCIESPMPKNSSALPAREEIFQPKNASLHRVLNFTADGWLGTAKKITIFRAARG